MRTIVGENGAVYIASDILPVRHAFSTRLGGKSLEAHTAELNLGFGRGDDRDTVLRNLEIFCTAAGVRAQDVVSLPQIHSRTVITVCKSRCGEGYFLPPSGECDGYVTAERGVVLGVKTADCVPVLLCALSGAAPVAVAAVHAGWRGTAAGIVCEATERLRALAHGCEIVAAIGPAISRCCFEVGEDFALEFGEELSSRFVFRRDGRTFADLKAANAYLLERSGVKKENIDVCDLCTYCEEELFYSHRRMHGVRGTMLSIISL